MKLVYGVTCQFFYLLGTVHKNRLKVPKTDLIEIKIYSILYEVIFCGALSEYGDIFVTVQMVTHNVYWPSWCYYSKVYKDSRYVWEYDDGGASNCAQ